jgi:putative transposase
MTFVNYKRCKRWNIPGDAHCLTFSCYHRLPLLRTQTLCAWLAEAIGAAREREQFDLWGYVFMPEHVHLLLMPRNKDYSISHILSAIKRGVAYKAMGVLKSKDHPLLGELRVDAKDGRQYRLWQAGGGHDRNLYTVEAVHQMLEYIHNNPVRRGLVESALEWEWSSARDWHGKDAGPLRIDRTSPVLMS